MDRARYILVVDDDPTIASTLCDLLALENFETATAPHGAAALESCAQREPDAILLDMRMPVMDGWEFARRYRLASPDPAAIVCMTAARDAAQWAAEIGAEAHVAKPFDVDTLLAAVESAVGRPRARVA